MKEIATWIINNVLSKFLVSISTLWNFFVSILADKRKVIKAIREQQYEEIYVPLMKIINEELDLEKKKELVLEVIEPNHQLISPAILEDVKRLKEIERYDIGENYEKETFLSMEWKIKQTYTKLKIKLGYINLKTGWFDLSTKEGRGMSCIFGGSILIMIGVVLYAAVINLDIDEKSIIESFSTYGLVILIFIGSMFLYIYGAGLMFISAYRSAKYRRCLSKNKKVNTDKCRIE